MAQRLAKQLGWFLRKKRGSLTHQQFSRKLGVSDSALQRLEHGQQRVTLGRLEQILERLKCELADVFPNQFPCR
jgi:transcriptional regulator with XRE-family HTH domain